MSGNMYDENNEYENNENMTNYEQDTTQEETLESFLEPEEEETQEKTPPTPEECKLIVCPTCDVFKEADDIRVRALAEMENFKKRLKKEKDEQMAYAAESVLADLIPSLDNLDLALQYGSTEEVCQNTIMGVEMTRKLLIDAIKKHGLETFGTAGEAFDPEKHEALSQEVSETIPSGHIVSVMQKGYMLKGRLLRPAKVSISQNKETGANFDATV